MKSASRFISSFAALLALAAAGCGGPVNPIDAVDVAASTATEEQLVASRREGGDSMFIGDSIDSVDNEDNGVGDSVQRFDARTGAPQGAFVAPGSGGLFGPRGLVFNRAHDLVVVNQNFGRPLNGEVLAYDGKTGAFLRAVVSRSNPRAPFAPRGIVRKGGDLLVADMGDADYVLNGGTAPNPLPARVALFDERTGAWQRDLDYRGFAMTCAGGTCVQWSPRGIVFGPDGALYVSVMKFVTGTDPNTLAGRIIRFPRGGKGRGQVLVDGDRCKCGLARPEGLTFGPDGKLYVTSFRTSPADNDKILVFDRRGELRRRIDLDVAGGPRAFAQALVFGPGGKLFVPILGNGPDTGSVRRYDVRSKRYEVVVPPGTMVAPWYITFGRTDSATLEYDSPRREYDSARREHD